MGFYDEQFSGNRLVLSFSFLISLVDALQAEQHYLNEEDTEELVLGFSTYRIKVLEKNTSWF